ncbi:amidase [Halomonas salipaludis]|uniref:Amidase n=1 Tax=Halomonas salipaludis TaxID=2032625 RepID=A0A2A2F0K1_9GAMM|nr:amidase [Halomonas salipaludis]PAU78264.1 amidase [Halomonas salipaludis]
MHDNATPDAQCLADAFRRGSLTPSAWLQQLWPRIHATRHVFTHLTPTRAEQEAAAATQRWREGRPMSPFDGVPMAWKDLFDVAGTVTTAGAEVHRQAAPAPRDATLVAQAARAGLVCVGKTNLSELAYSGLGLNPHFGTPTLPCGNRPARVPGGSSSGSAIAVAQGLVPIAMGTDTAGSIRVPAAFNGLVGFRPSQGRYAGAGVFPLAHSFDCPGPLASSVADVVTLDALLSGRRRALPTTPLTQLHLVVDQSLLDDLAVSTVVRDHLERALSQLTAAGAKLERRPTTTFKRAVEHITEAGWLGGVEAFALHRTLLDSVNAKRLDPRIRQRLEGAREFDAERIESLQRQRQRLTDALCDELGGVLLVTPTVGHVAPPLAPLECDDNLFFATNAATLRLTMPGSLMGMPGISLPCGRDAQGLASGLLLSGPSGSDERVLSAATSIAKLLCTT